MFKKRILSLALVFSLSFCSFLPAAADTSVDTSTDTSTVQPNETEETPEEATLFDTQQFKDAMTFLTALNKTRIAQGITPLSVTEETLNGALNRAKELEISYITPYRPNTAHTSWITVYQESQFIKNWKALDNGYEFIGTETTSASSIYNACKSKHSLILLRNDLSVMGIGSTDGTVYHYNEEKETTTKKKNPWAVHFLGKYTVKKIELAEPLKDTYPAGYTLDNLGIVLKVTLVSPEKKQCVGYLPLLQSMTTGYSTAKTGTQTVVVTYKDTYSKGEYKPYKKSLTFKINTKKGEKPTTPTTFQAAGTSYNKVTLTWSPADNAHTYEIYRSEKRNSGYKKIASLKASSLTLSEEELYTYIDKSVKNGVKYYYKLRGVNGSVYGTCTEVDPALPNIDAPTGLKYSRRTYTTITVKWNKVANATRYRVYYSRRKNGQFKRATRPSTTGRSYTIKNLKKRTTYYIKVLAYRSGRPSSYSKTIAVRTR